jgi:UDP-N-acetylmuramoyl-L-alanyl-D-glutamate--2,6-diaminopimelate ligase
MTQRCVLNLDDDTGAQWATELRGQGREVVTYGMRSDAVLHPSEVTTTTSGSRFSVDGRSFELRLPGRFNISNALATIAVARMHGIGDECSAQALAALERVAGRMERIAALGFDVVVDYAHTPDALSNALSALRETTAGKVAVVFGCGGDRDRGKRPEMGAVAARLADRIYLTNDNPRTEEPSAILRDIRTGIPEPSAPVVEEPDRRRAIARAVSEARAGDVVLVAGKGHETYQIVGDRVDEFDDAAIARAILAHLPAR